VADVVARADVVAADGDDSVGEIEGSARLRRSARWTGGVGGGVRSNVEPLVGAAAHEARRELLLRTIEGALTSAVVAVQDGLALPTIHTSSRDDPHTPHKLACFGEAMRVVLVVGCEEVDDAPVGHDEHLACASPKFRG